MSPIAPFFGDWLYRNLNPDAREHAQSVHLGVWPAIDQVVIDPSLEQRMELAQQYTSMILALRKKVNIRVRQPLSRILIPVIDESIRVQLDGVKELILAETNVKHMEYVGEESGVINKRIKPDFKALGPKYGKLMKSIATVVTSMNSAQINELQRAGTIAIQVENQMVDLSMEDVEIFTDDIPGWLVASEGAYTIALDVTLSDELVQEGLARELVNKIQNLRKTSGLEVTDRIEIIVQNHPLLSAAIENNKTYICAETLGASLEIRSDGEVSGGFPVELTEEISTVVSISKLN